MGRHRCWWVILDRAMASPLGIPSDCLGRERTLRPATGRIAGRISACSSQVSPRVYTVTYLDRLQDITFAKAYQLRCLYR